MSFKDKGVNKKVVNESERTIITKAFKGLAAIAFLIFMLFVVIEKISGIKELDVTGWLGLAVLFVAVTLFGVKLSNFLDKKNNLSEDANINISIVISSVLVGLGVYLFWDLLSPY